MKQKIMKIFLKISELYSLCAWIWSHYQSKYIISSLN